MTGLDIVYGPHSVRIGSVPVRRWHEQPWWWTRLTGRGAPPTLSLLQPDDRDVGGAYITRHQAVTITEREIGIGLQCWPLDSVTGLEHDPARLTLWVRVKDGALRRYELGHGWARADRDWLAQVLQDALDGFRAHQRAVVPLPERLRRLISRC